MIQVIVSQDGQPISAMTLAEKQFRTGSRGFFANGKVEIGSRRYQAQFQLVEIGSKPGSANTQRVGTPPKPVGGVNG